MIIFIMKNEDEQVEKEFRVSIESYEVLSIYDVPYLQWKKKLECICFFFFQIA